MHDKPVEMGGAQSVCPQCLRRLDARRVAYGERVYLEKTCPEHGFFRTLIWEGATGYAAWAREIDAARPDRCATPLEKGCPYDCGLCPEHRQRSCCVLIEVTQRCNLCCPVCFASAGEGGPADPSLERIEDWLEMLLESGGPFNLQLSGGEPTVRKDLADIIRLAKRKGFPFLQLNTNGLRLGREPEYAQSLGQAGLDCVYLQFDAVSDPPYQALRGRPLWALKQRAVENCAAAGLGIVLVPTLVPGVNDGEVGGILRFAFDRLPWVRGVHFQPVSYFGRNPGAPEDGARMTLPALLHAIEQQTGGALRAEHFGPSGGQNAYCGFNGSFLMEEDGNIRPLAAGGGCCGSGGSARAAQEYVARRWSAPETMCRCGDEPIPQTACHCGDEPAAQTACRCNDEPAPQTACRCGDEPAPQTACHCGDEPAPQTACHCGDEPIPQTACRCNDEPAAQTACSGDAIRTDALDAFLARVKTHTLAVSCMVFQDAWNLELNRLRQCHIHVVSPEGKLIPFCAYNLTAADGRALYRGLT